MSTCDETRRAIRRGDTASVVDHLDRCEPCRDYEIAFEILGPPDDTETAEPAELDRLFERTTSTLEDQPQLRRVLAEWSTGRRQAGVASVAFVVALIVFALARRPDLHAYPLFRMSLEASAFAAMVFSHLWFLFRPLHRPRPGLPVTIGLAITTLCVLAAPLILPPAHTNHVASLAGIEQDLLPRAAACFGWGTLIGAALAVAIFFFTRGAEKILRAQTALWIAAALFAQFALHLHCPIVHPLHIALGHTSIVAAAWVFATVLYFKKR